MPALKACIICGQGGLTKALVCEQCVSKYGTCAVGFQYLLQDIVEHGYSVTFTDGEIQVCDNDDKLVWAGTDIAEGRRVAQERG